MRPAGETHISACSEYTGLGMGWDGIYNQVSGYPAGVRSLPLLLAPQSQGHRLADAQGGRFDQAPAPLSRMWTLHYVVPAHRRHSVVGRQERQAPGAVRPTESSVAVLAGLQEADSHHGTGARQGQRGGVTGHRVPRPRMLDQENRGDADARTAEDRQARGCPIRVRVPEFQGRGAVQSGASEPLRRSDRSPFSGPCTAPTGPPVFHGVFHWLGSLTSPLSFH